MSKPTRFAELKLVALKKNALRWRKLPIVVRTALVANVARVRGIREDIERNALTGPMPPVRIVDIAWATERGNAHGRTVPVLRWGDGWLLGAELAAPTALYADDTVLRGVLLHEFAHCFYHWRRAVTGTATLPRGVSRIEEDEAADRAALENPADWFGDTDVKIFPYWNDPIFEQCNELVEREWLAKGLPRYEIPQGDYTGSIVVPSTIKYHVEKLERR